MSAFQHPALRAIDAKIQPPWFEFPGQSRKARGHRRILGDLRAPWRVHVMSRMTDGVGLPFWDDVEKEALRKLIWQKAEFCCVRILTYCVMGNHFHALIEIPEELFVEQQFGGTDGEKRLFEHLAKFYSDDYLAGLRRELDALREQGLTRSAEDIVDSFRRRIGNLPWYLKEVKETFTKWYNKRHDRKGILWMERYKSVLVEDGEASKTIGAYIDLNPVRSGLVHDPKDYRWSGYAEAVSGSRRAQSGLQEALGGRERWSAAGAIYRQILFETGREKTDIDDNGSMRVTRRGIDTETSECVSEIERGKLSRAERLRCRVRYFTGGVAIGSQEFVENVFANHRWAFGPRRETGARRIRGDGLADLCALRDVHN